MASAVMYTMSPRQLREMQEPLRDSIVAMCDMLQEEKRDMSEDERIAWNAMNGMYDDIGAAIKDIQKFLEDPTRG